MNFDKLMDADNLQAATDKQIANAEIVLVLTIVGLGTLLVLSTIVLPALSSRSKDINV